MKATNVIMFIVLFLNGFLFLCHEWKVENSDNTVEAYNLNNLVRYEQVMEQKSSEFGPLPTKNQVDLSDKR